MTGSIMTEKLNGNSNRKDMKDVLSTGAFGVV